MTTRNWLPVVVIALVASLLAITPVTSSSVVEAQTAPLIASKSAPGDVLAGDDVAFTIGARNNGTIPLYNLSLRDQLPLGATYIGPSTPSEFGEPEIITTQEPNPGGAPGTTIPRQTLIWSNIADLQAASSVELTFSVRLNRTPDPTRPSLPVYLVGSTVQNSSSAFASPNERVLPRFDAAGRPITDPAVFVGNSAPTTTRLTAIQIRKSEPSPEGELLRGIHRHTTVYTLEVETTDVAPVTGATVTDYLPAQLEFLGCGGVDNWGTPEYSGAPLLTATPAPSGCRFPNTVETVVNPPPDGTTTYPAGVYTKVTWILTAADTAAGSIIRLPYRAGIPLRANVAFPAGTATTGVQASNLSNNTGGSTRELVNESSVTNIARASGTYTGAVAPGASTTVSDEARLTRTVEDIRMIKSIVQPVPNRFRTGALAIYELTVNASEYIDGSAVVIEDTIPNGLCPISNVAYTSVGGDCGAASAIRIPTLQSPPAAPTAFGFASVAPAAGGGFVATFPPLPAGSLDDNDTVVLSYHALMRTRYEGGGSSLDQRPPVSGDSFTNTAALEGITTPIDVPGGTGETGPQAVQDGSSATLTSGGTAIDKRIRLRNPTPLPANEPCPNPSANDPAGGTTPLDTVYVDSEAVPPGDQARLAFRLGDEICFLLRVDFDPTIRTRNAVVTDFLPAGVEYVDGSLRATSNQVAVDLNLPPGGSTLPTGGPLTLVLGTDDPSIPGPDRYVSVGGVMEVVFKARVVDIPDSNVPLVTGNLMKMRTENSAGEANSFRDRVGLATVPAPPISLLKGVAAVDVPAFTTTQPNRDNIVVQQGSRVTYRLDLANGGTAANFNNFSARGFTVWDALPDRLRCADVVPGSITAYGVAVGPPIATCTDPGAAGHPTFASRATRSAIVWNLATDPNGPGGVDRWTLPAGQSRQLGYQVVIPTPTSLGVTLVNDAAVRSFEAFTNQANQSALYFPAQNVDTTVTPAQENAPAAADPSSVRTPGATPRKTGTTSVEEDNNDRPRQAVPGELITYTIGVDVPPRVTVYEGVLTDILPGQLDIVTPVTVTRFIPNAATPAVTAPFPAPGFVTNGFVLNPSTGSLTFPRNPVASADTGYSNNTDFTQRFEVDIVARVRPGLTAAANITNRARFRAVDRPGGTPIAPADATYAGSIIHPVPSVSKRNEAPNGVAVAGQRVRYVVGGSNEAGRPPLHDAVISDCIPSGLAFDGFDPTNPAGTTTGPTPGNPATNGCPGGSTFISFSVGTILGGSTTARAYFVRVEATAVGGTTYTNTARIVGSSLANGANDTAVETVYRPGPASSSVRVPGAGNSKVVDKPVATIGELVTYSATTTIPANVNFYQAALRDLLPLGVDPSTVRLLEVSCVTIPAGNPSCELAPTPPLLGPVLSPTNDGYLIAVSAGDLFAVNYERQFTVRYEARVANVAANRAGVNLVNRLQSVWDATNRPEVPDTPLYPWERSSAVGEATTRIVEPSLDITKSVSDATPEPGESFIYRIDVTNARGPNVSPAFNVRIVDLVPAGVLVSAISPSPTLFEPPSANNEGRIEWQLDGPIAPGVTSEVSYTGELAASGSIDATPRINTANIPRYEGLPTSVAAGTNRRVYALDAVTATVTPQFPKMQTVKTAVDGEPTFIGSTYRWRVTATNIGTGTARGVSVTDLLPPNWTYLPGSARVTFPGGVVEAREPTATGGCPADRLCWFGLDDLMPGASVVVDFATVPGPDVPASPGIGSTIRQINTAASNTADGSGATGNLSGPYASGDVTASTRIDAADLLLDKSSTPPAIAGRPFTWTIDVSNKATTGGVANDRAVGRFVVTDTLPPRPPGFIGEWITFSTASGTGWTCTPGSGAPSASTIVCERSNPADTLAAGAAFGPIRVTVNLPSTLPSGTEFTNAASVVGRTYERTPSDNADTDRVTTTTQADLRIAKNRTNPVITAGRTTSYTLDVTNLGPSVSRTPITVRDPLPTNASFVSASGPGWTCGLGTGADSNVVICTYGADLAVNEVASQIQVTVRVNSGATGELVNTATVTGTTPDPVPTNNSATDRGPISQSADLRIEKQNLNPSNVAGIPTQYRLRVDNDGPSDAVNLTISDALPAGLTFVSSADPPPPTPGGWTCVGANGGQTFNCSRPSLAAGANAVVIINVAIAPGTTGTVTNTASVTSPTPDPNPNNNTDSDTSSVVGEADLQITKTASTPTVVAGTNLVWTLQVTNLGPSDSAGGIRVDDSLPPGVEFISATGDGWVCPTAPLPVPAIPGAGPTVSCTRAATLPAATTPAPAPNVAPPITLTVRVLPDAGPGQIDNTASVVSTTKDPNLDNNDDDATVQIVDVAELSIRKVTTGVDPVLAGEDSAFTITVSNFGPSVADSVVVDDPMPAGLVATSADGGPSWLCSVGDGTRVRCERPALDAGTATVPFDAPPIVVTVDVDPGVPSNTLLSNTAAVDSATDELPATDPGSKPNTSTDTLLVLAEADLSIVKTHAGTIRIGNNVTFTMRVANAGPSAARRVAVTDSFPVGLTPLTATGDSWTCTIVDQDVECDLDGLLGAGASTTITMTARVEPEAFPRVSNTAVVDSETTDPNLGNNSSTDPVDVPPLVDLTIVKTHAEPVDVGQPIVYMLVVGNDGPIDDPGVVTVSDTLPSSLVPTQVTSTDADTTCSFVAQVVTCTRTGLAVGETIEITITATVLPAAYPRVENTATVTSPTDDVDPSNNSSTDVATVPPLVDLAITKSHASPVQVGGTIRYTLTAVNNGPTPDPGPVTISDTLPFGLTPTSATGAGVSCSISSPTVLCTSNGPLGVGESLVITVLADVGAAAHPSVTNVAVVTSPGCVVPAPAGAVQALTGACRDTNLGNNRATDVATVAPLIRLELTKTLSSQLGLDAIWRFDVRNTGLNSTIQPIVVTDPLPTGLLYVSSSGTGWACTNTANVVTCTYAESVSPGASAAPLQIVTRVVASGGTQIVNVATVEGGGPNVPSTTDDATVVSPPTTLPSTGGGPGILLRWAPTMLLLGLVMVVIARRRRDQQLAF